MADNPYINKVVYGDQTLIDLTEDTVSPSSLKLGNTAHDASGAQITGTADDAPKRTIAYIFSETDSYSVSDYVYYENQLYKCTTAHTGTWNAEHFTLTTVGDELNSKLSGLTILSYGKSTWDDFIAAYMANRVVYCRASSNSNPASGSQTRLAFMAYVSNEDDPTNVEFQYYRSVTTHTASQQGDQVFVYKLDKSAGWSVTTRNALAEMETADAQTAAEIGIVITGARPSMAVTAGQYVIVRNSTISGITDGLYTANSALSPSTDVTAANLLAVSNGGLNALKNLFTIETLNYSEFNTTNFELESWGNIYITKCGPIVLVGVSGVKAKTAINSNTVLCKIPITARSATIVPMVHDVQMFIQLNNNKLFIVGMTQGATTSGQIAILTDF